MTAAAGHPVATPISRNHFLQALAFAYALLWLWGAWAPLDRPAWLLENLLVLALAALLVATHRRFVFSNLSHALLAAFMSLHVVGSHYTYSQVPVGHDVARWLGLERNHYDRFVHFAYGLLLAYPWRELVLRQMHVHRRWSYVIPVFAILATSAGYEILESWAARLAEPEVGIAFVGAQGDVWDHQKDMAAALAGALLAMLATRTWRARTGHEPYVGVASKPSSQP